MILVILEASTVPKLVETLAPITPSERAEGLPRHGEVEVVGDVKPGVWMAVRS